jgi:hypothetical protein
VPLLLRSSAERAMASNLDIESMNNFPNFLSKSPLIGAELVQVCIGLNEIILHFYPDGISITILNMDNFLHQNAIWLKSLLSGDEGRSPFGKTIKEFFIVNQNTAQVLLSNGDKIILEDNNPAFEAVVFKLFDETYVV